MLASSSRVHELQSDFLARLNECAAASRHHLLRSGMNWVVLIRFYSAFRGLLLQSVSLLDIQRLPLSS